MKHSLFSASSSKAWLSCHARIVLSMGLTDTESASAIAGTRKHAIADDIINNREVKASAKTVQSLQYYTDYVLSLDGTTMTEVMVDYSHAIGADDGTAYGTADCININGNVLTVIDLKTGRYDVSPIDNSQLMLYALGALVDGITTINLVIAQSGKINTHVISIDTLLGFSGTVKKAVKRIKETFDDSVCIESYTKSSYDNCNFCLAKDKCPALSFI